VASENVQRLGHSVERMKGGGVPWQGEKRRCGSRSESLYPRLRWKKPFRLKCPGYKPAALPELNMQWLRHSGKRMEDGLKGFFPS
jgi:hypothetical protein